MRKWLIIFANKIKIILNDIGGKQMEYLPVQEFSDKWAISKRRIQILCKEGRIPDAKMIGNMWLIPKNAKRPGDARIKSPIVRNYDKSEISQVRKELKKLLKLLYASCKKKEMPISHQKDYVLTILASALCAHYLNISINTVLLTKLYHEISENLTDAIFDLNDIQLVIDFITNNKNNTDLEDLISWAYQYSNKYVQDNEFFKTQFFTEKYMIRFLINNMGLSSKQKKILDPCVGGGNFLVECLDVMCSSYNPVTKKAVIDNSTRLYGFDIDNKIARIAVINIKLRVFAILKKNEIKFDINDWDNICPNIFMSEDKENIQGSLTCNNKVLINIINGNKIHSNILFANADIVLTNPPFASIKGMRLEQKNFLKKEYPKSNCDTCVAFMEAIKRMLKPSGKCGIVSQSSWMFLKSFESARDWMLKNYTFEKIVNLGSGAFQDLTGEKSNVSLIIFSPKVSTGNDIEVCNVQGENYAEKVAFLHSEISFMNRPQAQLNKTTGFDFAKKNLLNELKNISAVYGSVAVPMQGTSTGNSKELVGFFWEHFGDNEWISVSNGGGYCRWQGLNDSVVKWGRDGEYIKAQKGSALRNTKYFSDTQMVFSDTGTAGLNVRILRKGQIFIASGPGIRINIGNTYAHLALLNSRFASYCIRQISPKLTIAAGYIGQIPIKQKICTSIVLEKNARLCVELKNKLLSIRPTNLEYDDSFISSLPGDIDKAAWYLFNEDLTNELMKLELEYKNDLYIMEILGLSMENRKTLDNSIGKCAYDIGGHLGIDLTKLDTYLDKLTNASCCLKRTKHAKNALGSDGYLEYISKDLDANPEFIVRKIQEAPYSMKKILAKYKSLLLHNFVLYCMGYNIKNGVLTNEISIKDIDAKYREKFNDTDFPLWICRFFNEVHSNIFKGHPYLIYEEGIIHKNDKQIT